MKNQYDIAVVGLGSAGAVALIAAARSGLRVIGIERLSGPGGTATLGGVRGYYFGSTGGLYQQINRSAESAAPSTPSSLWCNRMDFKAYALEQAAVTAGAEIAYNTVVFNVISENKAAKGLILLSDGETREIQTKFIIDCTADAHIVKMLGCAVKRGRAFDSTTQPYSNVLFSVRDGQAWGNNIDAGYVNQYDSREYSRAVISSLTRVDTKKSRRILTNASILGIREGATIVGEENIELAKVMSGKPCENAIFYAYSNLDNHGKDTAFEDASLKEWIVAAGLWGINFTVPVPAGALIPKGFDGILAAGRHLAAEHSLTFLLRMKSDMEKSGEAAAALAALAIKDNISAKNVDREKLLEALAPSGWSVGEPNYYVNRLDLKEFQWPRTPEEIREEFETGRPGLGIWGAKLLGDEIAPVLEEWIKEPGLPGDYSAVALGLLGYASALPRLREIAARREMTIPKTSLKFVYTLGTSAIFLLGRAGDAESLPILREIVQSRGEFDESRFVPCEFHNAPEDVKFQHISHSVAALLDLYDKCPDIRDDIKAFLTANMLNANDEIYIYLKGGKNKSEMSQKIREYIQWRLSR